MKGIFAKSSTDKVTADFNFNFHGDAEDEDVKKDDATDKKKKKSNKKKKKKAALAQHDGQLAYVAESTDCAAIDESDISISFDALGIQNDITKCSIKSPLPLVENSVKIKPKKEKERKKKDKGKKTSNNKNDLENNNDDDDDDDDDDIDAILNEAIQKNKELEQLQHISIATKNPCKTSSSRRSSTPPTLNKGIPHFKSPNDPELDEKTRMMRKFGNGKNLVAIGPRKVRDPLWKSTTNNTTVEDNIDDRSTHSSTFTFKFDGYEG